MNPREARTRFHIGSRYVAVLLASIFLAGGVGPRAAQPQGVIGPSCVSALLCRGLVVDALSVYATMANANGEQQITTSFRVINRGPGAALASSTLVQVGSDQTSLKTPPLAAGDTSFFSTTTTTTSTDFIIRVTTTNDNTASFHFVSNQPALERWRPVGPSVIVSGRSNNPEGVGRITTIAVDPSAVDTVYAGSRASGLWKTTDGGAHWQPLTDALPTVNIYAVALDALDPMHVFIATPAGIFGSTDGGQAWVLLNSQDLHMQGIDGEGFIVRHIRRGPVFLAAPGIAADPAGASTTSVTPQSTFPIPGVVTSITDELRLYASTQNGLTVSRDGGVTWLPPVLAAGDIIESLDQDRSNPDHLLTSVVSSNASTPSADTGVYETLTGGLTPGSWHRLQGCPGGPAPDFSPAAFPSNGAIWVTQSGGTQWISDKAPLGGNAGNDHELWRTTNETCMVNGFPEHGWQLVSSGNQTPCISQDSDGVNAEWSYLRADPASPNVLYKAGIRLCKSTDAGATFHEVAGLHVDHHALVFHPTATNVLFDGNDGGLYRSGDGGETWTFDAEGLAVTEFLDVDRGGAAPLVIVGGSQDNQMSYSDLSSPVWRLADLGADSDGDRTTAVIDPLDTTVQYSVGQSVDHWSILKNGVAISHDVTGLPPHCRAYDETPRAFTQFLATTNAAWHLLTTVGPPTRDGPNCNGGLWTGPPWRPLFVPSQFDPSDLQVLIRLAYDPSRGLFLAGGSGGAIYIGVSPDVMAKVWTAPGGAVTAIVPDPSSSANYFVSLSVPFSTARIFAINPSGSPLQFNGQDISANLPPGVVVTTLAANPFESGVLYAGTQGAGVFKGERDATGNWSWRALNNGLPQGAIVTRLRMGSDGTVYAGTWGRGAFALDTVANVIF